jgi:hypothetical protein
MRAGSLWISAIVVICAALSLVAASISAPNAHADETDQQLQSPQHSISIKKSAAAAKTGSGADRSTVTLTAQGNSSTQTTPLDIAVVLDTGYAMSERIYSGSPTTKIAAAKTALQDLSSSLLSTNPNNAVQLSLITFSDSAKVASGSTSSAFTSSKATFDKWVSSVSASSLRNSTHTFWDTGLNKANGLTTRAGATKVVLFFSQGYPATMYSPGYSYSTYDYFNPIAYANAQTSAKTLIDNNWSMYNIAFYDTVHPCVSAEPPANNHGYVKRDWNSKNQCYINPTTTWSSKDTGGGQSDQFYDSSVSGSYPVGSADIPAGWRTPFDDFVSAQKSYAAAAGTGNTSKISAYYLSSNNLGALFTSMAQDLTNTYLYSNVSVTQKLSGYVDPAGFDASGAGITAAVTNADGSAGTTSAGAAVSVTKSYDSAAKTLTVTASQLDVGQTLTVSYDVVPTQAAYKEYLANGYYPNVGDDATGATSADQDGFYIDDAETGANLQYSVSRVGADTGTATTVITENAAYLRPVIQVTPTATIPVEKQWGPDPIDENPSAPTYALDELPNKPTSVMLHLLQDGTDTGKKLVLNDANEWKGSFTDVELGHVYSLSEDAVTDAAGVTATPGAVLYKPCFISNDAVAGVSGAGAAPAASDCTVTKQIQQNIDLTSAMSTTGWTVRNMAVLTQIPVTFKVVNGTFGSGSAAKDVVVQQVYALAGKATLQKGYIDRALSQIVAAKGYDKTAGSWDVTPNTTRGGLVKAVTYTYTLFPMPVSQLPLTGGAGTGARWLTIAAGAALGAVLILAVAGVRSWHLRRRA